MNWTVYILKCRDGTLYTGITNNLDARLSTHNRGKGARYTRGRLPVKLIYQEEAASRSEALKREIQIKALSAREKRVLSGVCD